MSQNASKSQIKLLAEELKERELLESKIEKEQDVVDKPVIMEYDKKFCKDIRLHCSKGLDIDSFPAAYNIKPSAFYDWMATIPEFTEACDLAAGEFRLYWGKRSSSTESTEASNAARVMDKIGAYDAHKRITDKVGQDKKAEIIPMGIDFDFALYEQKETEQQLTDFIEKINITLERRKGKL